MRSRTSRRHGRTGTRPFEGDPLRDRLVYRGVQSYWPVLMLTQPDLATAAHRVLAPGMTSAGYVVNEASRTAVTLVGAQNFLRLSYLREDLPNPWLVVTIGKAAAAGGAPIFVALWRVFPDAGELQDPERLRFRSQDELEAILVRIRDSWFPRYIAPAFASEVDIPLAIMEQEREMIRHHEALTRMQHIQVARSQFDRKHYQDAITAYILAGAESLSAADRRRLTVARRMTGHQTT